METEEEFISFIQSRAIEEGLNTKEQTIINGPAEISYGYGWEPTITFWFGRRRVHFYGDVEVADLDQEKVLSGDLNILEEPEKAWEIIRNFLTSVWDFDDLPDLKWKEELVGHDGHIPDPPDKFSSANIADLVKLMKRSAEKMDGEDVEPES